MLSLGLSQARERNTVEASMITASVAETAPGWLHPRDGRGPPASGWAAQGLTPTVGPLPCTRRFSGLGARLLSWSLPSWPSSSPAPANCRLETRHRLSQRPRPPACCAARLQGGQPHPQPRPWGARPPRERRWPGCSVGLAARCLASLPSLSLTVLACPHVPLRTPLFLLFPLLLF